MTSLKGRLEGSVSLILMNIYKRKSLHPLSDSTIETPIDTQFFTTEFPPSHIYNLYLKKKHFRVGGGGTSGVVLEIFGSGQTRCGVMLSLSGVPGCQDNSLHVYMSSQQASQSAWSTLIGPE